MPDIRSKVLGYVRDAKVRVIEAHGAVKPALIPMRVGAIVQGFHGQYWIRLNRDGWLCSCGTTGCAHLAAVQLVTGHPSAADKSAKDEEAVV